METTCAAREIAKSEAVGRAASSLMPGGVLSAFDCGCATHDRPVFRRTPPVIAKGKGATLTDVDGNEYVDYIAAHGALILGHADERIVAAISKAASKGCAFGAPSETAVRLAELIVGRIPWIEMVRLVNTPADALADVVSLARLFTGREGVASFEGYAYEHSICEPKGGTEAASERNLKPWGALPYNDVEAAEKVFRERGSAIAAVVVEPVGLSTGLIAPTEGFLPALRALCDAHGALLIFDERLSGFRAAPDVASTVRSISPDLSILGPIVGGGMPLGAYGGRRELMEQIGDKDGTACRSSKERTARFSPASGNLLAMAAGVATLQAVGEPGFYEVLDAKLARLDEGLRSAAAAVGAATYHTRVGGILGMFFTDKPITGVTSARWCDATRFARYWEAMLDRNILLPPFPLSGIFVSSAHTDEDIDRTIEAAREALRIVGK